MNQPDAFVPGDEIRRSEHMKKVMREKGFSPEQIATALFSPEKITEVRAHQNQWRFCGGGVAVVVSFDTSIPTVVTVYLDGVITPLREDQKSDPRALASKRLNG